MRTLIVEYNIGTSPMDVKDNAITEVCQKYGGGLILTTTICNKSGMYRLLHYEFNDVVRDQTLLSELDGLGIEAAWSLEDFKKEETITLEAAKLLRDSS